MKLVILIYNNKLSLTPSIFINDNGKLAEFYHQIAANQLHTDEQAADFLYKESKDNAGYKKLRGILKNRLIEAVLHINLDHYANTQRQEAQCRCYFDYL